MGPSWSASASIRRSSFRVGGISMSTFNAEDPVLHRVVPYSDQQIGGTYGGPIAQNKLHFFANYEYERQPLTSIWQTLRAPTARRRGLAVVRAIQVRTDQGVTSAAPWKAIGDRSNRRRPDLERISGDFLKTPESVSFSASHRANRSLCQPNALNRRCWHLRHMEAEDDREGDGLVRHVDLMSPVWLLATVSGARLRAARA